VELTGKKNIVNMLLLKQFAIDNLPKNSHLRSIILAERDHLTAEEFIPKISIYLQLQKLEGETKNLLHK
jgi:hypothetical protein